ncbi:MAG: LysE family transporter [Campylobacterales bacterium]|nr:LysE family transporter [Campylobacterales bacterium]
MFSFFLQGLLFGFGAAVPLGPINILIMNRALRSYALAVTTGLGALSADLSYILLLTFGFGAFLQESIVLKLLGFFGSAFLIYMAYRLYIKRDDFSFEIKQDISKGKLFRVYASGYMLTLLNPYTIAFWMSVATFVVAKNEYSFLIIFGMVTAIVLWITIMPYVIYRSKHRFSKSFHSKMSLIAAVILFCFGVYLLYITLS